MTNLEELAKRLDAVQAVVGNDDPTAEAAAALREAEALLRRIRASINTDGELSVLCMQDIDALLGK